MVIYHNCCETSVQSWWVWAGIGDSLCLLCMTVNFFVWQSQDQEDAVYLEQNLDLITVLVFLKGISTSWRIFQLPASRCCSKTPVLIRLNCIDMKNSLKRLLVFLVRSKEIYSIVKWLQWWYGSLWAIPLVRLNLACIKHCVDPIEMIWWPFDCAGGSSQ